MDVSTIQVENKGRKPLFLQFTADDSHRVDPGQKLTIPLLTPVSVYYLLEYVGQLRDAVFYDKEGTEITVADIATLRKDLDTQRGVPPYRNLPTSGKLTEFVEAVKSNVDEAHSTKVSVTIKFMSGEVEVQESVVQKLEVGTVIKGTDLKSKYAKIGDYDLEEASATDYTVVEDKNVITLTYVKATGKVTVKFVDGADSTSIKADVVKTGEVGSKEVLKPDAIENYENPSPTQKTVTYTREPQEVTFTYTKKADQLA